MFDKIHISFGATIAAAVVAVFVLSAASSPASAALCGDSIGTTWLVPTDTNQLQNDTNFTGCSTTSTYAGDGVFTIDPDPFSITVSAIDNDTFQLIGSIENIGSSAGSDTGDSPFITLTLFDIDVGPSGSIDSVTFNPGLFGIFGLNSFTADTITVSGSFFCVDPDCPYVDVDLGTFDIAVVPLPAAAWMFLTALGGLGFVGWGRQRRATA